MARSQKDGAKLAGSELVDDLAGLAGLSFDELRVRFRRLYRKAAPAGLSRALIARLVAHGTGLAQTVAQKSAQTGQEQSNRTSSRPGGPPNPRHCRRNCSAVQKPRFCRLCGWGGRIRTSEWRYQKPLPYHLATPQCGLPSRARRRSAQYRIGVDHKMSWP